MFDKITREDVLLYCEGLLTESSEVALIEEARRSDTRVAALFDEVAGKFEPTPETLSAIRRSFPTQVAPRTSVEVIASEGVTIGKLVETFKNWHETTASLVGELLSGLPLLRAEFQPALSGGYAKDTKSDTEPPTLPTIPSIEIGGGEICVRQTTEDVPFGVVQLFAVGRSGKHKARWLLAMPQYSTARGESFRMGKTRVAEMLAQMQDPRGVDFFAQPAIESTLACFEREEVEKLLESKSVAGNMELEECIRQLLAKLESAGK